MTQPGHLRTAAQRGAQPGRWGVNASMLFCLFRSLGTVPLSPLHCETPQALAVLLQDKGCGKARGSARKPQFRCTRLEDTKYSGVGGGVLFSLWGGQSALQPIQQGAHSPTASCEEGASPILLTWHMLLSWK